MYIYLFGLSLLLFYFYIITYNQLESKIKQQEDIIKNKNIKLKKLEDLMNTPENKIFEKYLEVKNENNKLLAKLKYYNNLDKINESKNTKDLNYEINKDLIIVREENAELKKKIEQLENLSNKDFENYKKIDYNPDYIGKQLEYFYDLIINIKSIRELSEKNKGWEIK